MKKSKIWHRFCTDEWQASIEPTELKEAALKYLDLGCQVSISNPRVLKLMEMRAVVARGTSDDRATTLEMLDNAIKTHLKQDAEDCK